MINLQFQFSMALDLTKIVEDAFGHIEVCQLKGG